MLTKIYIEDIGIYLQAVFQIEGCKNQLIYVEIFFSPRVCLLLNFRMVSVFLRSCEK